MHQKDEARLPLGNADDATIPQPQPTAKHAGTAAITSPLPVMGGHSAGNVGGEEGEEGLERSMAYQSLMRHRRERKRKRIIKLAVAGAIALAAVVGIVVATRPPAEDPADELATASVAREDFVDSVTVSGAAQPVSSVIVNPEVDGTIDEVMVKEGDTVEAGQTLFTLKNDDLDKAVREADAQVKSAENGVQAAKDALASAQGGLKAAQRKLQTAQASQANPQPQPQPQPQGGAGSADDAGAVDDAATADAATNATPTAEELQAAVDEAEEGVSAAQDTVNTAKTGLTSAQQALTSAQDGYQEAVAATGKRTVTAPTAGAVIVMKAVPGATAAAGASDTSGQATSGSDGLVQIADLSQMRVSVQVGEADIEKIKIDQKATITFSALSDVTCEGVVQSIATVASDSTNGDGTGTATYTVELLIAQPDPRIKPGMTASVEIVAQEVKDALTVPATALLEGEDGTVSVTLVTYADDGSYTTEDVPVEVVAKSSTTAAIKGQVHEGDLVLLGGGMGGLGGEGSADDGYAADGAEGMEG